MKIRFILIKSFFGNALKIFSQNFSSQKIKKTENKILNKCTQDLRYPLKG